MAFDEPLPRRHVLASLGADMGGCKVREHPIPAAVLANTIGAQDTGGSTMPSSSDLLRWPSGVARKRGVAVKPQPRTEGKEVTVTVTYVDDGRVLDTPDALSGPSNTPSQRNALKGHEMDVNIVLRRRLGERGEIDVVRGHKRKCSLAVCDGLVSENDTTCPHWCV